jgi:hypothetical protein
MRRLELDKYYENSNTSAYNIYSKCYNISNIGNSINLACEDESGPIDYTNQPDFK